ncbi:MAG: PEGA domain-containing protein, partial [Gammaproteobacteria bacterium]|nr:PEGA domain-containing protein [Gemmatimonadota bacterium]NIU77402.1 PEGA domain-containing protein [Gammaproteobacteria bacterium]
YLARKEGPEGFSRDLVIKRMLPHLSADSQFRALFREEARIVARLNHPNVVGVYDFGEDDQTSYLVMELVRGVDLRALVARATMESYQQGGNGAVPPHHAAKILSLVCEGLAHAHSLTDGGHPVGLVHRDVTPSNVLVSFEGAVKVVDFGVAKLQRRSRREATQVGMVRGKHAYLSPEQARGERLDARSDLFNVGILLYESVTGDMLFPHGEPRKARLLAASGKIPDPSRLQQLPDGLRQVAERALAPRKKRYPDALALRADLEAFLRSQPHPSDTLEIGNYVRRLFPDVLAEDQRSPRAAGTVPVTAAVAPTGTAPLTGDTEPGPTTFGPGEDTPPLVEHPPLAPSDSKLDTLRLPASRAKARRRRPWPWAVAALLLAFAGAGAWALFADEGPPEAPSAPPDVPGLVQGRSTPEPGMLRLRTEPSGLGVRIDGEDHGPAPVLASLSPGSHRIEVLHDEEVVTTDSVTIASGGTATVVLTAPVPGWVRVRSEPAGAQVTIAGEDRGETPLDVSVPPGEHRVEVSLEDHEPHSELVLVEPGREASLSVALREAEAEPEPAGRMRARVPTGTGYLSV